MIHIAEMWPDIQQGEDCEFNCTGCPYMEGVEYDETDRSVYVKCKNN